jgi:hypothetical protein
MKYLLRYLAFVLMVGNSYAQSPSEWIEDAKTNCKVFNPNPKPQETVEFVGNCTNGFADGSGVLSWYRDGVYIGKNEGVWTNGKLNGKGTLTSSNGDKYVGEYKDGKKDGKGTETYSNGNKYVGEYRNGTMHGQGTFTFSTGSKYEGEFKYSKRDGFGTFIFPNGDKFVGEFKDGFLFKGNYSYTTGDKYEGEFRENKANGYGTFIYSNGAKYVGEWKDAKYHGKGSYTYVNKDIYVGEWKNGLRDGKGIYTSTKGEKYDGEYKDNKINGEGSFTFSNGDRYVGEFKDDLKSGRGTYFFLAENQFKGDVYIGEYKDSKKHGQGTYTFSNGAKYVGEFQNDSLHGQGTYTYTNGEKYVGEMKNGIREGQGTYFYPNGSRYVGEWKNSQRDGFGIEYASNNSIFAEGIFSQGKFVRSASIQQTSQTNVEIERLRFEAEEAKRKQAEAEEQLRISQQQNVQTTQLSPSQNTSKRIALVIGNSNYKIRPLKNPRNDADDISRSLRFSGFEIIDLRDASLQQMRNGVRQFGDRLINNDVGLVYYSGHGVEVKGRNYFIPINADIMREDEIADQGLDVALVLEKMNTAGKGVNILIVDACRDDPFGRSFRSSSRGLAQMDAPRGTIIAYATSPGKVASDGDGRNSPYTRNLIKAMQQPNKPIEQVFKEVRRAVQEETKNQQTPWENTSLSGDFYFKVQR